MKVLNSVLRKIRNRGDINDETLNYFLVNKPKLGGFYLLPRIHKRLHNVPGRPAISNSSYFNETGPILEFKGCVWHVQKGHPTFVTQIDLILQNL